MDCIAHWLTKPGHEWATFSFFPFIFISWRLITLQYYSGFCHTLTWISHGFTRVPLPDPPPASLSILSLWVFPVHHPWALVSCIQPGLVMAVIFKSLFFKWRIILLQGCVAFCSTTMWFSLNYIYIPSLWSAFPPQSHLTPLGCLRAPDWASYAIFKWRTKINIYNMWISFIHLQ